MKRARENAVAIDHSLGRGVPGIPSKSAPASCIVLGVDPGATTGFAHLAFYPRAAPVPLDVWDTAGDEEAIASFRLMLDGLDPVRTIIAIETVHAVHGSERMGSGYATGLVRSNHLAGIFEGIATERSFRVVRVIAGHWRKALAGSSRADDAAVARMVRLRVPSWPAKSNEHQRDAAGVALFVGLNPALHGGGEWGR